MHVEISLGLLTDMLFHVDGFDLANVSYILKLKLSVVVNCVVFHTCCFISQVKVTKKTSKGSEDQAIRYLQRGEFFGEKALQGQVKLDMTLQFDWYRYKYIK